MSGRGGTYRGPQGQQLYGDGREVNRTAPTAKPITRLEQLVAQADAIKFDGLIRDLLAVAEAARGVAVEADRVMGHDILVHKLRFERLVAALTPLLKNVDEPRCTASACRSPERHIAGCPARKPMEPK